MYSFESRLNTVITLSALLLALLFMLSSFTGKFNYHSIDARVEGLKVIRFRKHLSGNDEASLTLNISIDLRSTFTWNTKQVFVFVAAEYETEKNSFNQMSLWDHIIQDKNFAKLQTQTISKYLLMDQGSNLRGRKINLVLHWHIMPKIGRMVEGRMMMSNFSLPEVYT